ncbi:unnamed protein product, partial [Closterium sp. NIES-65]
HEWRSLSNEAPCEDNPHISAPNLPLPFAYTLPPLANQTTNGGLCRMKSLMKTQPVLQLPGCSKHRPPPTASLGILSGREGCGLRIWSLVAIQSCSSGQTWHGMICGSSTM